MGDRAKTRVEANITLYSVARKASVSGPTGYGVSGLMESHNSCRVSSCVHAKTPGKDRATRQRTFVKMTVRRSSVFSDVQPVYAV